MLIEYTEQVIGNNYVYTCNQCKNKRVHNVRHVRYIHSCNGPPKLGDRVALLLKKLGIGTCGGCDKRRQWLNQLGAKINGFTNVVLRSDNSPK